MTDRQRRVLDAALRVFSRYGVKRSSMSDIAEEAGISRQTLYKSFRSKDDVLRAHIRTYADTAIAEIEVELKNTPELGAQLDLIFDKIAVAGFDMVQAMPNAQDLEEGYGEGSKDELDRNATRFRKVIADVLSPYSEALKKAGLEPETLAEFAQRSARAAKRTATDRAHLLTLLGTLRKLCLEAAKA